MLNKLAYWPPWGKVLACLSVDVPICMLALWVGFSLRTEQLALPPSLPMAALLLAPLLMVPLLALFGFYRTVIRHLGVSLLFRLVPAITVGAVSLWLVFSLFGITPGMNTPFIISWAAAIVFIAGSRLTARTVFSHDDSRRAARSPVLIYGAGDAGQQLFRALAGSAQYKVVAFIDDKPELQGREFDGVRVFRHARLEECITKHKVQRVLLAMPSLSPTRRAKIIERLEALSVSVMVMPSLADIASGKAKVNELREVDIIDLLGRDTVAPIPELLNADVTGKHVMVTGAGGSIGSELARQIMRIGPARLVLVDHSEFALYEIERQLRAFKNAAQVQIEPQLGNVQKATWLQESMRAHGVQTVYHAAAYKHVPLIENNVAEGAANNMYGTLATARAAVEAGVKVFVLVSTDKAVRPENAMGASKRLAEMVIQGMASQYPSMRWCAVRFGNVLDSSGSVIPLFREQIRRGGPITVTDEKMTRFFMTIPEAAELVIQAGAMGKNGEIYVLDMGTPIRIMDIAERMIRLSGLERRHSDNADGDIEIRISGIRPGEKLHEELLISPEQAEDTRHEKIVRAYEAPVPWSILEPRLLCLKDELKDKPNAVARGLILDALVYETTTQVSFEAAPDSPAVIGGKASGVAN